MGCIFTQPLRITVEEGVLSNISRVIDGKVDREDQLKQLFSVARHLVQGEIGDLLTDFRHKRLLGKVYLAN